jgi:hypothetical protein
MELDRKEKAPVREEGPDFAAVEDRKDAVGDKAKVAARGKTEVRPKVAARPRGRDASRISELS